MKDKKCVTFWIDKDILKEFDTKYFSKSLFIRECIKKAIEDDNFYFETMKKKNGVKHGK